MKETSLIVPWSKSRSCFRCSFPDFPRGKRGNLIIKANNRRYRQRKREREMINHTIMISLRAENTRLKEKLAMNNIPFWKVNNYNSHIYHALCM